jgi:transposase InsO family protein
MLRAADEFTRECHLIHVARRIRARDVLAQLFRLVQQHGAPEFIRSNNGPEFIESLLQDWLKRAEIKTLFIDPGSLWQNGYIESFHSRFREECLDREQLWTLAEAQAVLEDCRQEYNELRPHKSLGLETPKAFAQAQGGASGRAPTSLRPRLDNPLLKERYSPYNLALGLT